ncbi:hypothetical protein [Pendulispora albinea]|uniref:Uncharacterized protein n=1 Tax=Pendulispora albinea TaxID=2741071 RepID=A0ABZ2LWT9_9BACT
MQNDGVATIYFYFAAASGPAVNPVPPPADLDNSAILAAGSPLSLNAAVPLALPAGAKYRYEIKRDIDRYLVVKGAAPSTMRIFPSSKSTMQAQ